MKRSSSRNFGRPAALLLVVILLFVSAAFAAGAPKDTMSDKAQIGSMGPGRVIELPSSDVSYTPTAAQAEARERLMEMMEEKHPAPSFGPHITSAEAARPGGPQTDGLVQQAATDFTVFKNSLINSICSGCGESTVNEPSAANSGKTVVETSNWNIAFTVNGGAAKPKWLNQNPYALSTGYCCDTKVVYDRDRDVFILLLLDYAGEGRPYAVDRARRVHDYRSELVHLQVHRSKLWRRGD